MTNKLLGFTIVVSLAACIKKPEPQDGCVGGSVVTINAPAKLRVRYAAAEEAGSLPSVLPVLVDECAGTSIAPAESREGDVIKLFDTTFGGRAVGVYSLQVEALGDCVAAPVELVNQVAQSVVVTEAVESCTLAEISVP